MGSYKLIMLFVKEIVLMKTLNRQIKSINPKRIIKMHASGMKALRDRMESVANTKKITDAMKLVAAAKVRRAQEAVVRGRPFAENLVKVLYGVNQRLEDEDVDSPLTTIRPVSNVLLVVITGDRGLCGGYNSYVIKKAVARIEELNAMGVSCRIINIGRKGSVFFKRRSASYDIAAQFPLGGAPTTTEAQAMA